MAASDLTLKTTCTEFTGLSRDLKPGSQCSYNERLSGSVSNSCDLLTLLCMLVTVYLYLVQALASPVANSEGGQVPELVLVMSCACAWCMHAYALAMLAFNA